MPARQQAIIWTNDGYFIDAYTSLGLNELINPRYQLVRKTLCHRVTNVDIKGLMSCTFIKYPMWFRTTPIKHKCKNITIFSFTVVSTFHAIILVYVMLQSFVVCICDACLFLLISDWCSARTIPSQSLKLNDFMKIIDRLDTCGRWLSFL